MPNQFKTILLLFISAFLILTITKGLVLCIEIFLAPPEYTFAGYDRSIASVLSLFFIGFTNIRILSESFIIAIPFVFSSVLFFNSDVLKHRKRSTVNYVILASLLLTALLLVKELLFLIGKTSNDVSVRWNVLRLELAVVLVLSFLVYLSLLFPLSKQIFKAHSTQ